MLTIFEMRSQIVDIQAKVLNCVQPYSNNMMSKWLCLNSVCGILTSAAHLKVYVLIQISDAHSNNHFVLDIMSYHQN